jgi:hypothetical protein
MKAKSVLASVLAASFFATVATQAHSQSFRKIFGTADSCSTFDTSSYFGPTNANQILTLDWGPSRCIIFRCVLPRIETPVTWDLEGFLGMSNSNLVLGQADDGKNGVSGIASSCAGEASGINNEVGFLMNTFQMRREFEGTAGGPLSPGGPIREPQSVVIRRDTPQSVFTKPDSQLVIQGWIRHPFHHWTDADAFAQIALEYSLVQTRCENPVAGNRPCGEPITHRIVAYQNNADGSVNETFQPATMLFTSPLSTTQLNGTPTMFATVSPYSHVMANRFDTWRERRFFRAHISREQIVSMINERISKGRPDYRVSTTIENWKIASVSAKARVDLAGSIPCEAGVNQVGCKNVSMAVTFTNIEAYEYTPR